jgi:excisionase family DNA binding protein
MSLEKTTQSTDILTSKEAAEMLKISIRTLQRRRDAGQIKYFRDGGIIRFRRKDIEKYLENHLLEPFYN